MCVCVGGGTRGTSGHLFGIRAGSASRSLLLSGFGRRVSEDLPPTKGRSGNLNKPTRCAGMRRPTARCGWWEKAFLGLALDHFDGQPVSALGPVPRTGVLLGGLLNLTERSQRQTRCCRHHDVFISHRFALASL